jgi:hypothetical protein
LFNGNNEGEVIYFFKSVLQSLFDRNNINHSFDIPDEDIVRKFPEIQTKL